MAILLTNVHVSCIFFIVFISFLLWFQRKEKISKLQKKTKQIISKVCLRELKELKLFKKCLKYSYKNRQLWVGVGQLNCVVACPGNKFGCSDKVARHKRRMHISQRKVKKLFAMFLVSSVNKPTDSNAKRLKFSKNHKMKEKIKKKMKIKRIIITKRCFFRSTLL